jgi:hypothetical protein
MNDDYMLLRAKDQQKTIDAEGMNWRPHTDVWNTWYERGPDQWRKWVKESRCTASTATEPRASFAQPVLKLV